MCVYQMIKARTRQYNIIIVMIARAQCVMTRGFFFSFPFFILLSSPALVTLRMRVAFVRYPIALQTGIYTLLFCARDRIYIRSFD